MYLGGMDDDERGMLHDLINLLLERINTQRRLNEDLSQQLDAVNQRLELLTLAHYGSL